MMSGILRCESSLMAIWSASVSPSRGTRIGAFILHPPKPKPCQSFPPPPPLKARQTHLICKALVPNILALSYFVKYGVVTLTLFGCLSPAIVFAPPAPPPPAPESTGSSCG